MDPLDFLESSDTTKVTVMRAVAKRMNDIRAEAYERAGK
jgi:hypothetical protein